MWQENYHAGDVVETLVGKEWYAGRVCDGWTPAPGFPVCVALKGGGVVYPTHPSEIRHAG